MNKSGIEKIPEIREDNRQILLTFYKDLDKVKVIEVPKDFNANPIRPAIMAILRNGVKDQDLNQLRYALNAREIKDLLETDSNLIQKLKEKKLTSKSRSSQTKKDKEEEDISYTNLYFHLNKLEEVGAINKVANVIERSHKIAYYGRTAHIILPSSPSYELKHYKDIFNEFGKFVQAIDPKIEIKDPLFITEKYYQLKSQRQQVLATVLADYEKILLEKNIDMNKLFESFKILDSQHSGYNAILFELIDIFTKKLKVEDS
jgi:DNA-binding transcriptional ArsR family regulator